MAPRSLLLLHLLLVTARASRSLLRPGWVILPPAVRLAMAKADCSAGSQRRGMETDSRRVVAAGFLGARFSPGPDLSAAVPSAFYRCPVRFATSGFVPAADLFDPAGSDFADFAVAAVAVVVVVAAGFSVVAADPGSADSAVAA